MSPVPVVEVKRWYAHPPALVFRAFTEPALIERWFCPDPAASIDVDRFEFRIGGVYRYIYRWPDGRSIPVTGTFRAIDPPHGLAMTWTWEPPDPDAGILTLVTIALAPRKGGTALTVIHEELPRELQRTQHASGWAAVTERLETILPTIDQQPKGDGTMNPIDAILGEMEQEAVATRRLLERVPDDKLGWRPHPKSHSLGQLAMHVAEIPGNVSQMATLDTFDIGDRMQNQAEAKSRKELLAAFEQSLSNGMKSIRSLKPERLGTTWTATRGGKTIASFPRAVMLRTILLNHNYHHRGQLTVYLRMLGVPLPSVYGPSADENPFA